MYRFTTPTHRFKFKTNPYQFADIEITYTQQGNIVMVKYKEDLSFDENNIVYFVLTQEESSKFKEKIPAKLQVRVLTSAGRVFASKEKDVEVLNVLNETVWGR